MGKTGTRMIEASAMSGKDKVQEGPQCTLRTSACKCGIVTISDGSDTLSLIVRPKVWSTGLRYRITQWSERENRCIMVVDENQYGVLTLDQGGPRTRGRQKLFANLLTICQRETEEYGHVDPLAAPACALSQDAPPESRVTQDEALSAMLNLLLLQQRTKLKYRSLKGLTPEPDSFTAPLVHWLYLEELEAHLHDLRRGYVEDEALLGSVRGRVIADSVAVAEAGGDNRIQCRFDSFTEGTPLLRVLVTAIETVAGGTWVSLLSDGGPLGRSLRNRASSCRRLLANIPALPRDEAVSVGRRLRLTRLTRRFEDCLSLAQQVLEQTRTLFAREGINSGAAWIWTLDTSAAWERMLMDAFHARSNSADSAVHFGKNSADSRWPAWVPENVHPPWSGLGGRRLPDILALKDEGVWILDAKYKGAGSGPKNVDSADQNQMFVYAHMTLTEPPAENLAVVYPVLCHEGDKPRRDSREDWAMEQGRWTHGHAATPRLHRFDIPFPEPEALADTGQWHDYLERAGKSLHRAMKTD